MSGIGSLLLGMGNPAPPTVPLAWSSGVITSTHTTGTQHPSLVNVYYRRRLILFSYDWEEIQAATGKLESDIHGLRFSVNQEPASGYQPLPSYAVGMKEGSVGFNNDPGHTGYTVVSSQQSQSFTSGQWKEIMFDAPFSWGGDDLAFAFAWGQCPAGYDASGQMQAGAGTLYHSRSDNAGAFVINTDDTTRTTADKRPVMQLYI